MSNSTVERIVLIGFMGAGKSTIGRLLASEISYHFVDTDQRLVQHFKMPIYRVFQTLGESTFREAESALMRTLLGNEKVVIATGGGTVSREDVFSFVQQSPGSVLVYLKAPVEVLYERVIFSPKDRPLIDVPNAEAVFRERFAERESFYNQADLCIETNHAKPGDIIRDIQSFLAITQKAD